jgi:signal transduction histidine kinase
MRELEQIAKALQMISSELTCRGIAEALLAMALDFSEAIRGAVLLSERCESLNTFDDRLSQERFRVIVADPPVNKFQLPAELSERAFRGQETIVRDNGWIGSAFSDSTETTRQNISLLCLPLIHQERTIGVLYLEAVRRKGAFPPRFMQIMLILASQAAVSFEAAQFFAALHETSTWMAMGREIGLGGYRWNARTQISRASRELYRIFDIDLSVNPIPFEVFKGRVHPDDFPTLARAIEEAVSAASLFNHEYRVVHKDGTTLHVLAIGQVDVGPSGDVELHGIISDVTMKKTSEQALADASRELARTTHLASLGELAGSIIHEVNQPLAAIMLSANACLKLLEGDAPDLSKARRSATRIAEQTRRASDIIGGLKTLVRSARIQLADLQLNRIIEEVLTFSTGELERAGVTLRTECEQLMPNIEADRLQIQQVVLNLVRNAIDAMTDVERPRILTCSSKAIAGNALVMIADTGMGIDPSSKDRLFDALYTTKSEGLGLGLSICRRIVSAHGGRLWLEKSTAHGATFAFTLPFRQTPKSPRNERGRPYLPSFTS